MGAIIRRFGDGRIGLLFVLALFCGVAKGDDTYFYESVTINGDGYVEGGVGGTIYINNVHLGSGSNLQGVENNDDAVLNSLEVTNDLTIDGDLVYQRLAVSSSNLTLGTWGNGSAEGVILNFHDNNDHLTSNISWLARSPQATWKWQQDAANSTATQMTLNTRGNLTLTDNTSGNIISINPSNYTITASWNSGGNLETIDLTTVQVDPASAYLFSPTGYLNIGANISFDASDTSSYQALTLGTTYLKSYFGLIITGNGSSSNITLLPSSQVVSFTNGLSLAPGSASSTRLLLTSRGLTIGTNATTTTNYAVAIAGGSLASAANAVAISGGNASGVMSVAMGINSSAISLNSTALAGGTANATAALAFGNGTIASGNHSAAIGTGVIALTPNITVFGRYNTPLSTTGNTTLDPALVVGNGTSSGATSNALVVLNNGNTTFSGNVVLAHTSYVSPLNATQPTELTVTGASAINGNLTLNGNVSISQRRGDISMGQYNVNN